MKKLVFTIMAAFAALALQPALCMAGAYKTGGNYEIQADAIVSSGGKSTGAGGYALTSATGQGMSRVSDAVGGYSLATGFLGVVDEMGPRLTFANPAALVSYSGTIDVAGTAMDETGTAWTLYYGPGASPASLRELASGTAVFSTSTLATWDVSRLAGTYTLALVGVDGRGNTASATVTFSVSGTAFTIQGTVPALKWVLLGIPARAVNGAPASLFSNAGEYKVYRWDPAAADEAYQSKYRYPATLDAGSGFWIKSFGGGFPYSYSAAPTDTSSDFHMQLKSGWNQVCAPFDRQYPWSQVRITSGGSTYDLPTAADLGLISSTLYGYDEAAGSWAQLGADAQMQPQRGYFIRAYSDIGLAFPPGAGVQGGQARVVRPVYDFVLRLSATSTHSADLDNRLGAVNLARDGFDTFDAEEPPRTLDDRYISLYFPRQDWPKNAGRYASDFRSVSSSAPEARTWTFNVQTNDSGEPVTVSWDASSVNHERFKMMLVNLDTGDRIPMAPAGSYSYTAAPGGESEAHFEVESVDLGGGLVTRTHPITPGWNLVSVPVEPSETGAEKQLGGSAAGIDVYQFFGGKFLRGTEADIQAGIGYWVFASKDTDLSVTGSAISTGQQVKIPLRQGWNMVGNPYEAPLIWGDNVTLTCNGLARPLSMAVADGTLGGLYRYEGDGYAIQGTGAVLEPWKGYAVKAAQDCELNITP